MSPRSAAFYPRIGALATFFATTLVLLVLRLAWLSSSSSVEATVERWREIPAPRGTIWDRSGALVASNTFVYDVGINLAAASQKGDPSRLSAALAGPLGLSEPELRARIAAAAAAAESGARANWMHLASGIPLEAAVGLESLEAQGVQKIGIPKRIYPLGADAAHLTGFLYEHVDPEATPSADEKVEIRGSGGIEAAFDELLQGRPGQLVGYAGTQPDHFRPARAGSDLRLTIDHDIQVAAAQALARTIEDQEASGGSVLVLEAATGAVLASTSLPSFDPHRPAADDPTIFADPAVAAIYEPGSVIKAVTVAAAIDAGAIEADSHYQDEGVVEYAGMLIRNWDHLGHGWISMREMMVDSLNVGAVWAARQLGRDSFYRALEAFGFGQPTGIDLASEVPGIVHWPSVEGADWYEGHLATNAFGQGMSATPIQVAAAVAAIANDGLLMRPYVVAEQIPVGQPPVLTEPQVVRRVIRPETARDVRGLMLAVVDDKVTQAAIPGYSVAGKTGTSQIAVEGGYDDEGTIASFAGILPASDPQIVILAKVDRPHAVRGSEVAAPLFREVAEAAIAALDIPPDRPIGLGGR